MGNRRFAQVATSDDEDDAPPRAPRSVSPIVDEEQPHERKRKKKLKLSEQDEEEEGERGRKKKKAREEEQSLSGGNDDDDHEEEEVQEDAKPIGDVVRVSGKGRGRRNHYESFEYDGIHYDLEDPVLLVPEEANQKPYVAIIKDISQKNSGSMMVTGQWFYRPEEAEKKGGGNWQSKDTRELFYSFHRDEVPAESVMHKCVAHFIPRNKQIPSRKQHPGFIVQKVYDTEQRRLFKLTDKDYEDNKQHEIDLLVQKTLSRIGDLPDIETDDAIADQEDRLKNSRLLRRKNISPLDVSRDDETTTISGQSLKGETPGSVRSNASEYNNILANFKALTGETQRDKWLDKLLQGIQFMFSSMDDGQADDKEKGRSQGIDQARDSCLKSASGSQEKGLSGGTTFVWPDDAVRTVTALEQASHDALSSDFQKYNQKMRQLNFNLKSNALLARRILNGELEPSTLLGMSPNELKEGLTAEEIASREPEEPKRMQMTDARCKRCMEKKVGVIEIIKAGHGERYQDMSSSTGASSTPHLSTGEDTLPLWRFVTRLEKVSEKGGNFKWKCNFCSGQKNGSYTRVKAHLLKIKGEGIGVCLKVTSKDIAGFHRLLEEESIKSKQSCPKKVSLPPSSASLTGISFNQIQEGLGSKRRRGSTCESDNPITKAFNVGARDQLHGEIARMFYSGGLPFNLARNPYYVSSYTFAANNNIPGYLPPGYNLLRTTLLQRERANIERLLDPIRGTWREKGLTIASDGWSDSQRRPLINFMAVTGGLPMFLKAVDCSGETKDKHFIASLMKEVIIEVGPKNVVQILTDNAPNCKAAGQIIEAQYPHIYWTPCVVHTLNLALKNICAAKNVESNSIVYDECSWISIIIGDAVIIKNFIMNHSMRLAIFNEFVSLKLLSVAETRFASSIVMLRRFKLIKQGLQSMVISSQWNTHREEIGASFVRDTLLKEDWWDDVDYILSFTSPIYDMLRECDTDKPTLHLIYDMWDTMIEKVKCAIYKHKKMQLEDNLEFYNVVHQILVDRWNKNNTPLHCLAHALNPRYYSDIWLQEDPKRVPPHKDEEVTNERKKCLKRYFDNSTERTKANMEYAKFSTKEGPFADVDSIEDRWNMDPHSWWVVHGASAPTLQSLALKILIQPSSSSCCERNWSIYSFIHSLKRNKMTPQRAEDLVYIHSNLRLLSRRSPQYCQGETKMWDIAGDQFGSLDEIGMLEVANLSLDEPEMEVVVFTDDGDGDGGEFGDEQDEVMQVGSN